MTYDKALIALNAGWNSRSDTEEGLLFLRAIQHAVGLCENKRVIVNARHELILMRAGNDYDCLMGNSAMEEFILRLNYSKCSG